MAKPKIKTEKEIEILREGGKRLAEILRKLGEFSVPGVTTAEIEEYGRKLFTESGGEPAFLGYKPHGAPRPFPASVCISINEIAVHGIPTENVRTVADGDLVMLDTGLKYDGLYTDSAITVGAGALSDADATLVRATKEAVEAGIEAAQPGAPIAAVGDAVYRVIAPYGFGIVRELGGHGVGYAQHEPPFIPNYPHSGEQGTFKPGMVVAIEPIINAGSPDVIFEDDGYTVRTRDGKRSAEFEHTVAITEDGPEILTTSH